MRREDIINIEVTSIRRSDRGTRILTVFLWADVRTVGCDHNPRCDHSVFAVAFGNAPLKILAHAVYVIGRAGREGVDHD